HPFDRCAHGAEGAKMSRVGDSRRFGAVLVALTGAACAPQPQAIPFRSLESSGTASFICLAQRVETPLLYDARDIKDCPDQNPVDGEGRLTYGLVTQTTRGEVAVVRVGVADTSGGKIIGGAVIDEEPAVPGFNFLPVGAEPVDIVSSPGSAASFVAT